MRLAGFKIILLLLIISTVSFAQEDDEIEVDKSTPDFLLEQDTIFVQKKKKKKRKKKTFNKLKTRRGYTTRGAGRGRTDELFFYLKKYREPSKYASPVFVYDRKKLRLLKVKNYSKKKYPPKEFKIPHGPYTKKRGDVILEEGYFWIGTLHDNWFDYSGGEEMIVEERREYHKGFPENYRITYYDPAEQTLIKEIDPYDVFKRNTGVYKYYYENGRIKELGKLKRGHKDGKWYEYYKNGKKKITIEYTWNEEEQKEESKVLAEYKTNGRLTEEFQKKKDEKKKKRYDPMKF